MKKLSHLGIKKKHISFVLLSVFSNFANDNSGYMVL